MARGKLKKKNLIYVLKCHKKLTSQYFLCSYIYLRVHFTVEYLAMHCCICLGEPPDIKVVLLTYTIIYHEHGQSSENDINVIKMDLEWAYFGLKNETIGSPSHHFRSN